MALGKNYRYKGADGKCRMGGHPNTGAMGIKGYVKLPVNNQSVRPGPADRPLITH